MEFNSGFKGLKVNQDSIVRVVTRLWVGQLIIAVLNGFRICSFFLLSSHYFMHCVCKVTSHGRLDYHVTDVLHGRLTLSCCCFINF